MIGARIVIGSGVALVCSILMPGAAMAQNAGIAGAVRDPSGAIVPGVTVEASSPALIEKVRSAVTDDRGLYRIVDLRPGVYMLTFSLTGFTTVKREGIELTASFTATVNAELSVGEIAETITVSGQSPTVDVHNVVQQKVLTDEVRDVLPTGRSIQTMAQIIPGMVSTGGNRPSGQDVGGTSGERGQVMIHGSRPQDVTIQLDGLALNNALADGRSQGFSLNPTEAEEYVYEIAALAADTAHGGVRANLIPKTGGNRFAGEFLGAYANGDFQSNNLTADLKARGLQAANPLESIYDWNVAGGGPLKRDKLWFFASFRHWGIQEQITGLFRPIDPLSFIYNPQLGGTGNVDLSQPEAYATWLRYYGLRLTWQATPKHKFGVYVGHQPRVQDSQGISATRTFEAAQRQVAKLNRMLQFSWKAPVTSRLLLEAAWASPYMSGYQDPTVPSITSDTVSVTDTGTGIQFRAAPNYYLGYYYQPSAKMAVSYITGSHAAKFGLDFGWGSVFIDDQRTNAGMTYTLQNGVPRSITLALSPRDERERFHSLAIYAQDQWTIKRLTINGGLRFDHHNEHVPEQQSGPGPIVPFQTWAAARNIPNWKDLSPRLGVSYDLFGSGKTALKMTASRYAVRDSTSFAVSVNPMLFNASASQTWNDLNRDYIPQADELGPLSNANFATAVPTLRLDDAIRTGWGIRPYNWEVSGSIQQQVLARTSVNIAYLKRWYGNFTVTDNLAVAPADYDAYCVAAPVDARLPGGGGNQICDLFDLNPSKVGQVNNLRTSADTYGTQKETFQGIDVTVSVRLPHRTQLFGGVSSGTSNNTGNTLTNSSEACFVVDSPGALRFCKVDVPWRTQLKALGTVGLPWSIDVGATIQSTPGPEILANYAVNSTQVQGLGRNLTTGTATVPLIQPGSMFGDRVLQLDLRLAKAFQFRSFRLRAMLDIGNALNASTVLLQNNTYGSNWLRPAYIVPGRLLKPTVDITF